MFTLIILSIILFLSRRKKISFLLIFFDIPLISFEPKEHCLMRTESWFSFNSWGFYQEEFVFILALCLSCIEKYWFWVFCSMNRISNFSEAISKANMAAKSSVSFPFISIWIGIQHTRISWVGHRVKLTQKINIKWYSRLFFHSRNENWIELLEKKCAVVNDDEVTNLLWIPIS